MTKEEFRLYAMGKYIDKRKKSDTTSATLWTNLEVYIEGAMAAWDFFERPGDLVGPSLEKLKGPPGSFTFIP